MFGKFIPSTGKLFDRDYELSDAIHKKIVEWMNESLAEVEWNPWFIEADHGGLALHIAFGNEEQCPAVDVSLDDVVDVVLQNLGDEESRDQALKWAGHLERLAGLLREALGPSDTPQ